MNVLDQANNPLIYLHLFKCKNKEILIHKSSLFSGARGFPGSKQLAVLPRIRNGGCFGDRAEGAEGA